MTCDRGRGSVRLIPVFGARMADLRPQKGEPAHPRAPVRDRGSRPTQDEFAEPIRAEQSRSSMHAGVLVVPAKRLRPALLPPVARDAPSAPQQRALMQDGADAASGPRLLQRRCAPFQLLSPQRAFDAHARHRCMRTSAPRADAWSVVSSCSCVDGPLERTHFRHRKYTVDARPRGERDLRTGSRVRTSRAPRGPPRSTPVASARCCSGAARLDTPRRRRRRRRRRTTTTTTTTTTRRPRGQGARGSRFASIRAPREALRKVFAYPMLHPGTFGRSRSMRSDNRRRAARPTMHTSRPVARA